MSSFKKYLSESTLSIGRLKKAEGLIRQYLARHFSANVFSSAGVESYSGSNGIGIGIRYYDPSSAKSVRFNWTSAGNENNLAGLTFWLKPSKNASHNVNFETGVSLVQVLPFVASVLNGNESLKSGQFRLAPIGTSISESFDTSPYSHLLIESYDMNAAFEFVIQTFARDSFTKHSIWKAYKSAGLKIFDTIVARYPEDFQLGARKSEFIGDISKLEREKDTILNSIGSTRARVTGGGAEKYDAPAEVDELENDRERISFEEQLSNLSDLIKLTVAGSSNACFVAGRGGCLDENTEVVTNDGTKTLRQIIDAALVNKIKREELAPYTFYDILDLGITVESPNGEVPIASIVRKIEDKAQVILETGQVINCSSNHYLHTSAGSYRVRDLTVGETVITKDGTSTITSIDIFEDQKADFYDIEVLSDDHLFYTADGVCHHNTGKSHTVEEVLAELGFRDGSGYFKTTGSTSAAGLYGLLFKHQNDILLFDDSDAVFKDQDSRNILKAATDTKKVRKLVWMKRGSNVVHPDDMDTDDIDAGKVPSFFEFTGKIIFISNLKIGKLDPDGALRTRGFMIDISPTDEEVYDFMEKIADRIPLNDGLVLSAEERVATIELLRKGTSKQEANLRKLVRALNIVAGAKSAGVSGDMNKLVALYA